MAAARASNLAAVELQMTQVAARLAQLETDVVEAQQAYRRSEKRFEDAVAHGRDTQDAQESTRGCMAQCTALLQQQASLESRASSLQAEKVLPLRQPSRPNPSLLRVFRVPRRMDEGSPTSRGVTLMRHPFAHSIAEEPLSVATSLSTFDYELYGTEADHVSSG